MSSRWSDLVKVFASFVLLAISNYFRYPLYQRGNPQLRVFLPNFYMKIIKPTHEQPPHTVAFNVSMEMTRNDVKNYLEKIYKIPVVGVRIHIAQGEFKKSNKGYVIKDDDSKIAYVDLV
jgi:large subunit ribosomal protein L23